MKLRFYLTFIFAGLFLFALTAPAQVDSLIGQATNSASSSFAGSVSGNGRFVVFESRGNLATENPRNADGNLEIFLWDYAQRRIFQITDTKNLLFNPPAASTNDNIRVEIMNTRPVISNDGKWIAFSSNATIAYPGDATHPAIDSSTNPANFDANAFTSPSPVPSPFPSPSPTPGTNPLTNDGNLEIWLYQIPAYDDVSDLSAGDEIPFTNLAPFNSDGTPTTGTFIRATNTVPSQLPRAGTTLTTPFVAFDNHDPSIDDDGGVVAFVSTRNLVPCIGNSFDQNEDNDEIFTFARAGGTPCPQSTGAVGVSQVTKTGRGTTAKPIYSKNPTISGSGNRVVFVSTGDNPIVGMTGGNNPSTSLNEEVFFANLDPNTGAPTGTNRQVTVTTPTNVGGVVNILDLGRRMSRDGRYIAFDSFADLAGENSGTNFSSFATYLYDTLTNTFRRIGPRADADSGAAGGDVDRYPGFTDTDANGAPSTLVLETRLNIKSDGTVPATASDGLNSDTARPAQIYKVPLTGSAVFTRLTKMPPSSSLIPSTQPLTSDSIARMAFNLAFVELGTGNSDLSSEVYYLLLPNTVTEQTASFNFATGASHLTVTASPTPTPTPTTATQAPALASTGVPAGYTFCANENQQCSFTGTASVAYGANDSFVFRTLTNGTPCNNQVFGDPIVGVAKACYFSQSAATPTPTPALGTFCANENQQCSFTGTATVAYGANGTFAFRTLTNGTPCNNQVFGDPIVGVAKSCFFSLNAATPTPTPTSTPIPTPTPTTGTFCANENQQCSFTGTATVAYGANGTFVFRTLSNGTPCNNQVFGDPIVGVAKACFVSLNAATPTPTPTTGTFCANENQQCSFTGTATVAYGANGTFVFRTLTNGTPCNNQVFGDPIFGVAKSCFFSINAGTPTPTPTATPTPTPTPTPSPAVTPTPTPSPTPTTPSSVLGLSPGMLASVVVTPASPSAITNRTAVGSLSRSFTLPIELSHFTVSINGLACGLKSVTQVGASYEIFFVVPRALSSTVAGTSYPIVVINDGTVYRSNVTIVPARPDIFTTTNGSGGRATIFNVTNPVATPEPFSVTTVKLDDGATVASRMRLYLTGVEGVAAGGFTIRIGSSTVTTVATGAVLVEPGVYTVDFDLPGSLAGAGDQPIVVTISGGGATFTSRLDDTAPRLSIL